LEIQDALIDSFVDEVFQPGIAELRNSYKKVNAYTCMHDDGISLEIKTQEKLSELEKI
jgi:CheY-like chemotaxis protein